MKFCLIHRTEHADFGVCRKCLADPVAGMLGIETTDGWILCPLCGSHYEPDETGVCAACDNDPSHCGSCGSPVVGAACVCGEEVEIYKTAYNVRA